MRIKELLSELTFNGSQCTKDCSGHRAGYAWAMRNRGQRPSNSRSSSFNKGTKIAVDQIKTRTITKPIVSKS